MTPAEKRRRFLDLAKQPGVEICRELDQRRGQLELDFTPARAKRKRRPEKPPSAVSAIQNRVRH